MLCKCENQKQYKAIIQVEILYAPEGFTYNIPISPVPSVTITNPSERKSLSPFTELLDVKKKSSVCRLGTDKSKCKLIISESLLWSSITKRQGHKKIN